MTTRRTFLLATATATATAALAARVPLAAEAKGTRPLPELVPDRDLPVLPLDVEASRAERTLILEDGKPLNYSPAGLVVEIPAGAEIPLPWWQFKANPNHGFAPGARIILRGGKGGPKPRLFVPGDEALLFVSNGTRQPLSFELENLHLVGGTGGNALHGVALRFIRVSNCRIEGGRNGFFLPVDPTIALAEDSTFVHGGTGDGLTHCMYLGYIERFTARRCTFVAARAEGHALKCYAAHTILKECRVSNWDSVADRDAGYYGLLPPVDLGAWARTTLVGNTFVRRGPARTHALEYRNRQYPRNFYEYVTPDWGTAIVDHRLVDNRDPRNPHLFHHVLANNRFINGVLPDGGPDPKIRANPGRAARNNGSGPWASHGDPEPGHGTKPADFKPWNERSVVWAVGNRCEGVPFERQWDEVPHGHPEDTAPIRALERLPDFLRHEV
ncbi:MAG: hypothetical protein ACM33T_17565 [Solirubrobacterales bacterium]